MAENRHAMRFARVPVRGVPTLFKLSAIVPRQMVTGTPGALNLVQGVTKYKDWALADGEMIAECGEFVYSDAGNLEWQNETQQFIWNPVITPAAAARPVKSYATTAAVHWPRVVYSVWIEEDAGGYPSARTREREAATLTSTIRVEVFVRNTPYSDGELQCNEPITDNPKGDFYGLRNWVLGECLHPEMILPESPAGNFVKHNLTPGVEPYLGRRRFYATNHTDWSEYVRSKKVDEDGGLYIMTRETVIPPDYQGNEVPT